MTNFHDDLKLQYVPISMGLMCSIDMSDVCLPQIYCIHGKFLVFDKEHAIALRQKRLIGQLIGSSPGTSQQIVISSLPCQLSQYAAKMAYRKRLATFMKLTEIEQTEVPANIANHELFLYVSRQEARRNHYALRIAELKRRNIDINADRLGSFDETKVKLTVDAIPNESRSNHLLTLVENFELELIFKELIEHWKETVHRDLYEKGFYTTSGSKFGCDFLAYPGDPLLYHAKFVIRIVPELDGGVDLSKVDFDELNALHRLSHTANKVVLYAVIISTNKSRSGSDSLVQYWTIRAKEYLTPENRTALVKYPVDRLDGHDGIASYHDHTQFVRR